MSGEQLLVKYRGGVPGLPAGKNAMGHQFRFEVTADGFTLNQAFTESKGLTSRVAEKTVFGGKWKTVQSVHLDELGGTAPRAGAVLAFGVAGLAARKRLGVSLTIEMQTTDLLLETKAPFPEVRSFLGRLPALNGKLNVNGRSTGGAAAAPAASSLASELRQLTELREAGHLTAEEFAAAKQRLIAGT